MPEGDTDRSWAHQMENDEEDENLSERKVEYIGDTKVVTEARIQDGKKVLVKQYFKTEKRTVSVRVAKRKTWPKFGQSKHDPPGPNPKTTFMGEEIQMEFLNTKETDTTEQDAAAMMNPKGLNSNIVCRNCGHNHWTLNCPFGSQLNALNKAADTAEPSKLDDRRPGRPGLTGLKDGKRLDLSSRGKDDNTTIRITNLPEETQEGDIRDLFTDFGRISRIYLAKDKNTGNSKGFAFVSFDSRENASRAIKAVNGHGYNNLILSVEWARPSAN